jgi:predicted nucleic acid-binding protein
MAALIDTSLWVDFTRARSPQALKRFIAPYILRPDAHLADPVEFEILRHATDDETRRLRQQFDTLPRLATPKGLWTKAAELGRACRAKGGSVGSLDLLIAAVAIHHGAQVITFDADFERISEVAGLNVKLLARPEA